MVLGVCPQRLGFQPESTRPQDMNNTVQGKNILGRVMTHVSVKVGMDEVSLGTLYKTLGTVDLCAKRKGEDEFER